MEYILQEVDAIKNKSQKSVNELRGISNFFKIFTQTYQEEVKVFEERLKEHEEKYKIIEDSILSANLLGIYECFRQSNKNTENLMGKLVNELINPYEMFRNTQFTIYQNNINELRELNKNFEENQDLLEKARKNYYHACEQVKKENQEKKNYYNKEENKSHDESINNEMKAKNYEIIYKYELAKYNNSILDINNKYNNLHSKIELADKSRIMFIKTSFDKFRAYMEEYIKNIKDFLNIIENYISDDVCSKDEKHNIIEFSRFKEKNKIQTANFISFNEYYEMEKDKKDEKIFPDNDIKLLNQNEKEITDFIKNLTIEFLDENEISSIHLAKLIELFQYNNPNSELEKKFMDTLLEKRKISSIRFYNLKNLEHLANVLSFITFKENSIFKGKFELNFKIIYIAERIYYENKVNKNKVYLSAILSKNKYYKTKTFWKNVMELRLANKLQDHILRLKNYILPEEKNKGFFRKISGRILSGDLHKNSLIGKSRILPLLKDYNNLEHTRVEVMDKMAIQEMTVIIKSTIPNFSNFNVSSGKCLDLILEIVQDYKIPKDNINYYMTYSNICGYTIRKLLPHEKNYFKNENINKNNQNNKNHQKIVKVLEKAIPFLTYQDFKKLLLISKFYNKKIKKKIYKYILKQNNTKNETRLKIWYNLLKINGLKKEYDYKKIISSKDDEKSIYDIKIDIERTAVNSDNTKLHREKISNILYAISQTNNGIKYCQGMNFISSILYEIFGEEEAFYIFLSFFKNTEYPMIFEKDLKKLKIFFYVFNRIIQLLEPELSSYLTMHNATVNTFMPPWFITLFTSSHQYLRGEKDNTNLIVRILDSFIVSGWKGVMTVSIALLHNFEDALMNKKYEAMMEFLINDMVKSEFFENKNKDKLEEYFENIKIKKSIIKSIELEFALDEKLNEINIEN